MDKRAIGVGKSNLRDPITAGEEAAKIALAKLNGLKPIMAIIFAATGYDQNKLMLGITNVIGNTPISGCSGEGIITNEGADEGGCAVGIMLFAAESKLNFHNVIAKGLKEDSYGCGEKIAKVVNKFSQKNGGVLMLYLDSMTANTTKIFKALDEKLKPNVLILGGTAGDMMKFKKTYQYHNGKIYEDAASAVYIDGAITTDWLVSHGCEEIGLEQTATKTDKNSLVEIDNQPTWEVFKKYLPGEPDVFKAEDAFHLCIGELHALGKPYGNKLIIRMPVGLTPETGAVNFSVEIPQGTTIHFTRRDPQIIAEKAMSDFKELLERNKGKKIIAIFQYDCAGRGQVIYGRDLNKALIKPLQQLVDPDIPWIGFFTYGEIAPIGKKVFFHNFTVVIGVLFAN
jgi:hypothetical protein